MQILAEPHYKRNSKCGLAPILYYMFMVSCGHMVLCHACMCVALVDVRAIHLVQSIHLRGAYSDHP